MEKTDIQTTSLNFLVSDMEVSSSYVSDPVFYLESFYGIRTFKRLI